MICCVKCNKEFKYQSDLNKHLNRKIPCNAEKKEYKCDLCNVKFKWPAEQERHEKTKKHITNFNIHTLNMNGDHAHVGDVNNIENNYNNIIHLTLNTNSFVNTNTEYISRGLIKDIGDCIYVETINRHCNELKKISILFDEVINLLEKLHFNIGTVENHNLKILLVFPGLSIPTFEYLILEIDNTTKKISWVVVDYHGILNIILDHLLTLNERYKNENYNEFIYYLKDKLINEDAKYEDEKSKELKEMISKKLSQMYIDFNKKQNKGKREIKFDFIEKIKEYKDYRKVECTLENGYTPEITNSQL